jgi:hypothetical protein
MILVIDAMLFKHFKIVNTFPLVNINKIQILNDIS